MGLDTESYASALKYVLRQDPDDILIGEMRDLETVRTALTAAQTGHFVMSTLHTIDATETVNRIIDFFPPLPAEAGAHHAGRFAPGHHLSAPAATVRRLRAGPGGGGHDR